MNAISPNVFIRDGAVFASSRDVAAYFEKRHDHVLRDVDNLLKELDSPNLGRPLFLPTMAEDGQGIARRAFDMTRDGFTLLAMGFTGPKALRFKLAYIEAFNAMETALKDAALPPASSGTDVPLQDRRLWIDSVALALRVYGVNAAQRLWAMSPLPQVDVHFSLPPVLDAPAADGGLCLEHLLSWEPLAGQPPLGVLLASGKAPSCRRELARFGIDPAPRGMTGYFAVAYTRQCRPLARRFHGTPWDGAWVPALLHIPGARRSRQSIWVGCTSSKAVMVPYASIEDAAGREKGGT